MIDINPFIQKLDRLEEYMDAWINLKAWMFEPLKPFPYSDIDKIDLFNHREYIDKWNKKYHSEPISRDTWEQT